MPMRSRIRHDMLCQLGFDHFITALRRVDAVITQAASVIVSSQKCAPQVDKRTVHFGCDPLDKTAVIFLKAVQHTDITEPAEDIVIAPVFGDEAHIFRCVDRDESRKHHLRTFRSCAVYCIFVYFSESFGNYVRVMLAVRRVRHLRPVEVAVVPAELK